MHILIDSSNLAFRCHYVNQRFNAPTGKREPFQYNGHVTSAIFGFFKSLLMIRRKYPQTAIVCIFDSRNEAKHQIVKEATEKGILLAEDGYKANRQRESVDYRQVLSQLDELQETLPLVSGVQVVKIPGQEADDIIGSWASQRPPAVIVSSDGDFLQLVGEQVTILDSMKDKTVGLMSLMADTGLTPAQMIDVGALEGDASDNIPGIPGIGEKTAIKLIKAHGSLETLLETVTHKQDLSKIERIVLENRDKALVCKQLKKIKIDLPLPLFQPSAGNRESLRDLFENRWGFKSLMPHLDLL